MSTQTNQLIEGLSEIPDHWLIIPTKMKMALGIGWHKNPYSSTILKEKLIRSAKLSILTKHGLQDIAPTGFALKCGANSKEFLLAIDCDGIEAYRHTIAINESIPIHELSKLDDTKIIDLAEQHLPPTVSFSSGREHRRQYLYKADLSIQSTLRSRIINVGNGNHLELRGTNLNSILPPSQHPMDRQYRWVTGSPSTMPIAPAPPWVIKQMTRPCTSRVPTSHSQFSSTTQASDAEIEIAKNILEAIHPKYADDYHSWIRTGMALKSVSGNLLDNWDKWSQMSDKYTPGICTYKWSTFNNLRCSIRSLYYLAEHSI
jgi:hypothetical protein